MNRVAVSIALALSFLLLACGNKGDLYLETSQSAADEIQQLDESLELIDEDSSSDSSKKPKKNSNNNLQTN